MTILGKHTVAETKELIQDYEWRIDTLNAAMRKALNADPNALANDPNLVSDWQAFLERWTSAKYKAKAYMLAVTTGIAAGSLGVGAPESVVPCEDAYQAILLAGSPTYPLYTNTDLPGLSLRIQKYLAVSFPPRPSSVSWDFDLGGYQSADAVAKGTAQAASDTAKAVEQAAVSHPGYIVGGAVLVVGSLYALRKLHVL